jgi:hypothetical protein
MDSKVYFHLVGYGFGMAAFAMIYWSIRPRLVEMGREAHLKALIPIHFFRYFGLTAMLPGVFNLAPAGFSQDFLIQVMAGDVLVAVLALISFGLLQLGSSLRIAFAWLFNVVGSLDYLNAAARVTPGIHDANILGPFGWIILTVFLPAWLISHIAIFSVLMSKSRAPGSARTTRDLPDNGQALSRQGAIR